jgi:hypothetical protein
MSDPMKWNPEKYSYQKSVADNFRRSYKNLSEVKENNILTGVDLLSDQEIFEIYAKHGNDEFSSDDADVNRWISLANPNDVATLVAMEDEIRSRMEL